MQTEQHAVGAPVEASVSRQVPERSVIRQYLIDYWEGENDNSMAHAMIFAVSDFDAVKTTVSAFSQHCDWLQQQCDEIAVLKARLETAEAAVESARQPLHAEMLRLNKRVIALTEELDRARDSLPGNAHDTERCDVRPDRRAVWT